MQDEETTKAQTISIKFLVSAICLIFTAGMSFTYYSSELMYKSDLKPVLDAVQASTSHETRLQGLEATVKTLGETQLELSRTARDLSSILKAVREASIVNAKCTWYRDQYLRDLTEYVTKVRKNYPAMSAEYRACATGATRWNLAEEE